MWLGVITMAAKVVRETARNEWVEAVNKLGLATVIAGWLVWFLTNGISGDIKAMRSEHQDLSYYLRSICIAVNSSTDNPTDCTPPPHAGP